jgi:hypothetical protein
VLSPRPHTRNTHLQHGGVLVGRCAREVVAQLVAPLFAVNLVGSAAGGRTEGGQRQRQRSKACVRQGLALLPWGWG